MPINVEISYERRRPLRRLPVVDFLLGFFYFRRTLPICYRESFSFGIDNGLVVVETR